MVSYRKVSATARHRSAWARQVWLSGTLVTVPPGPIRQTISISAAAAHWKRPAAGHFSGLLDPRGALLPVRNVGRSANQLLVIFWADSSQVGAPDAILESIAEQTHGTSTDKGTVTASMGSPQTAH